MFCLFINKQTAANRPLYAQPTMADKIPLNVQDLKFVQQQLAKSATAKLNLYLPTDEPNDSLKQKVDELVSEFITRMLVDASSSLSIEGVADGAGSASSVRELLRSMDASDEQIEPFDFSLQQRVRTLYQLVEKETNKLTGLRSAGLQQFKESYAVDVEKELQPEPDSEEAADSEEPEQEEEVQRVAQQNSFSVSLGDLKAVKEVSAFFFGPGSSILTNHQNLTRNSNQIDKLGQIAGELATGGPVA